MTYLMSSSTGNDAVVETEKPQTESRKDNPQRAEPQLVQVATPDQSEQDDVQAAEPSPPTDDEDAQAEPINFSDDDIFASTDSLEDIFIDSTGRVSQTALTSALGQDNFDGFVTRINRIEATEAAAEREAKMNQQLIDTFGSDVYQSNHACSERICAITFTSTTRIDEERLARFSAFGSHYRFTRLDSNEYDEDVLKAIYISTDNPSTLVFSPN
ncbi:hypothetical protein CWE14_01970 [Aliidiomarina soli]|uniref:Uncharacterized protein n=2 Tax=Aliidiomarina soli TaxID=1928574 RepID=A0A432WM66_9GAMM|nr:hypothetical protein CWE14_01970 [Aliidiomarina soli]